MPHGQNDNQSPTNHDLEVYPVHTREQQPNFILIAVAAFAIFLLITSYIGK